MSKNVIIQLCLFVKIMTIEVFEPWSATWLNCLTRIELELWAISGGGGGV